MDPDHDIWESVEAHAKPCKVCRQRKVRCSKTDPCSNCQKAGVECLYDDSEPQQSGRTIASLSAKVRSLENTIADLRKQLATRPTVHSEHSKNQSCGATSKVYLVDKIAHNAANGLPNVHWDLATTRRGRLVMSGASSRHLIHAFWGSMYDEIGSLQFVFDPDGPSSSQWLLQKPDSAWQSLCVQLCPSRALLLMKAYIYNVDQFIRILHKPTVLKQLNRLQRGVAEPESEVQLSAVFNLAVLSLSAQDCLQHFGESRDALLCRLQHDVEKGLSSLDITTNHSLSSLQTLLLHIAYLVWTGSMLHASSLLGLGVRIAQRLGVHRDGASLGLSPWQTELRRRIWHYVLLLDTWCMENHGLDSVVSPGWTDVRLPHSTNDAAWDISDSSTLQPVSESGFTDMTLALVQYEAAALLRHILAHSVPHSGQDEVYTDYHTTLRLKTWASIQERHLRRLDRNDLQQSLTFDLADLTFQRIHLTQLRPLARNSACITSSHKALEHKLITIALDFCDTVQSIRDKYSDRRLDWAIIRVFSWHALATELSTVLSNDAISTSAEAQRARQKIAKVFRDRPSIDYLRGNDSLWQPFNRLHAELEMRQQADEQTQAGQHVEMEQAQPMWENGRNDLDDLFDDSDFWQTF